MRIPMKVDYSVRALVDLALHQNGRSIQTTEIATRQGIPEAFLEQLLTTLMKFGFLRSRRGPQGGHMLARPPEAITLDAVIGALEGTVPLLDCLEQPEECTISSVCGQRPMWQSVEEAIQNVLKSTTVADLANQQRKLAARRASPPLNLATKGNRELQTARVSPS